MRLLLAVCLALVAGPALAQAQPATPQQVAAASAQADRLIAAADAQAWFENVTDSASPQVRHRPSGMRCTFVGSAADRIAVFPTGPSGIAQGHDVACLTRDEAMSIDLTLYATRYRPLPSAQAVLNDAVNAIRTRFPSATPYQGNLASMEIDDRGAPLAAAFNIETNQGPQFTMALVWHSDDWGYKARATGPQDEGLEVSFYTSLMFTSGLLELDD
jgi:hypothetical protein